MLCDYGCGNEGKFVTTSGRSCCSVKYNSCPAVRKRNANGVSKAHKDGKMPIPPSIVPWNKGKTGVQKAWNKGLPGTFKGKEHTAETKRRISESMCGNRNANHRGDRQSFYNGIRMDSKWEIGTAKYLDEHKIEWKYNEKGFVLSDGRYYYPDFFIYVGTEFISLIEVKGYFREDNRKKFEMFLLEYPNIVVELWQRAKLFEKGIITRSGYLTE